MNNTIAAISTAYGRGGIAVIRISGSEAIEVAARVFIPADKRALNDIPAGQCIYGHIYKGGRQIDDGMCTTFRAPRSYTGEDVVEISCHGGILLTELVLAAVFEAGAVQAGAGEFTRRAFINGKLSLSQAEAVGMLIDAKSEEQLALASSHERGVFRAHADALYERLKTVVTNVYAGIDFPDEDLSLLSADQVIAELEAVKQGLQMLVDSYRTVRAVCEGIRTVIAGKPNTGKSSLLNRLVGRDRAIVTDIAGTTRDTIEETVTVGRIQLRLCDTAGLHETDDAVERIGVERSLQALEEAELVLAVFDFSTECDSEDEALLERLASLNVPCIAVCNKSDLPERFGDLPGERFSAVTHMSASTGEGVDDLRAAIEGLFIDGDIDYDRQTTVLNARQYASAARSLEYVQSALNALQGGLTPDTAGLDMESALSELGELDGRKVTEEIVDGIFHHFCVGK
ncbi:MAG: tRNA uridine-5-carboxymethylaminomethyl(34) synthesis GTPase MnmE [Clostridia bacterium]|nr:tRNA uridine-5-carboxymethylaminomethyl(34) synthesis GTPase MnmE [Clostridia bacterium]